MKTSRFTNTAIFLAIVLACIIWTDQAMAAGCRLVQTYDYSAGKYGFVWICD